MSTESVSVIIPAYNEATYLGRLLEALAKQRYPDLEVIVSDADSKDGTDVVCNEYETKLKLHLLTSPPTGPAAGRNRGAAVAIGEWLLFLDADDDIDDPEFIAKLVAGAKAKGWQTATARLRHRDPKWREKIGSGLNYRYIKLLARTKHPVAPGWCILTKRQLFEQNHGFNEKIHFGEDYDYVSRVGAAGFGFVEAAEYFVDLRRARAEGWRLTVKAVANEIYRHTHGYNLENNPFKYEFGKHKPRT